MMVQSYMQDEGKARGIHAWAGEWQKEHAKPPQVWSCVCVWVMVGVVKYLPLLMSPKIPSSTCRPAHTSPEDGTSHACANTYAGLPKAV